MAAHQYEPGQRGQVTDFVVRSHYYYNTDGLQAVRTPATLISDLDWHTVQYNDGKRAHLPIRG
jgi:hypothetical protein